MRLLLLCTALLALDSRSTSSPPPLAAPPLLQVDSRLPDMPEGAKIHSVEAGENLQQAINSAKPGDVIELANGATYIGNFILPNKNTTSMNWIVLRPARTSLLPAEGSRMTPAIAGIAHLPIVLSIGSQGAFTTEPGAHHYRLIGLEVSAPSAIGNAGLIRLGNGSEASRAQLPHDLMLDRMYIHGTPTGNIRRCVVLNSAMSAVIDSYISDCHERGSESQAIAGWNGAGPFKIVNNYLEGASENISFGGAEPAIPGLIPSDIEIRRNHFFKPTGWKGQGWQVRSLMAIKSAQRVLVEGNVLENNWEDGQGGGAGSAVNFKSVDHRGACSWCVARDITFRLNVIRNTGSAFVLTGYDGGRGIQVPTERVTIVDNLVSGIDVAPNFNGDGSAFLINNNPTDVVIAHNTIVEPTNAAIVFAGPSTQPPVRLTFRDNIVGGGQLGVHGPGLRTTATFAAFMQSGAFRGNVLSARDATGFPPRNFFPRSLAEVGFANPATMDFRLSAGSAYKGKASDGRDPGADVTAVKTAIAGVVIR